LFSEPPLKVRRHLSLSVYIAPHVIAGEIKILSAFIRAMPLPRTNGAEDFLTLLASHRRKVFVAARVALDFDQRVCLLGFDGLGLVPDGGDNEGRNLPS